MIRIGNRQTETEGEYVGRPSPLGNQFRMKNECERDAICDEYDRWFHYQLLRETKEVKAELTRLYKIYRKQGKLTLLCWCAPKRCHAETIKRWLEMNK